MLMKKIMQVAVYIPLAPTLQKVYKRIISFVLEFLLTVDKKLLFGETSGDISSNSLVVFLDKTCSFTDLSST